MSTPIVRICVALLTLIATTSSDVVRANGRVARSVTQSAGPYQVSLGTIPATPVVGNLHLTMTVTEVSSQTLVLDAEVMVSGRGPGQTDAEIGPISAQKNLSDLAFYDVNTAVDRVGIWTFAVAVSGAAGAGSTEFTLQVETPSPVFRVLTWVTVVVFFSLVGLGLMPFIRQRGMGKRRRRERA